MPPRLLDEPERLRQALTPLRRQLLARLRDPASAAQLAAELDLPRQRLGYHLRVLEDAGLVELVEERRRRGFTERLLRTTATAFVVDPDVLSGRSPAESPAHSDSAMEHPAHLARVTARGDRHSADHLVEVAARTVRDVARMQDAAERDGRRLLTFTAETEVRLAAPADVHRFSEAIAAAVADVVRDFHTPDGRPYRLVATAHPAPRQETDDDRPT
ncbi:helix-turn-helix domain-containing protein [Thalassiella azotivora]